MAALVFVGGPIAGRRFFLGGQECLVGRRADCHIWVPDQRVSRTHARIRRAGDGWVIEDLGSNNGTYVNGKRISLERLSVGDEIVIADNRIRVESSERLLDRGDDITAVDLNDRAVPRPVAEAETVGTPRLAEGTEPPRRRPATHDEPDLERLRHRQLGAVSTVLESLASAPNEQSLLDTIVANLLEVFPAAGTVGVLTHDERTGELRVQAYEKRLDTTYGLALRVPASILERVQAEPRGVLVDDDAVARMGAPMRSRDASYGVIYVEASAGRRFDRDDLDLLTTIAGQAGLAICSARTHRQLVGRQQLERDVVVARQIQRSLLPKTPPDVVGLDFAVHYEPAYHIGGDFYDFVWHDDDHLGIVVGDVAGKAISAALYMSRLTSELRSRAGIARSPAKLLHRVNHQLVELGDDGMFATLVYLVYDLQTRTLTFSNAGHVTPLLRRDGRVLPLHAERAHAPPLGIIEPYDIGEATVQLHAGDMIVLATDGIHEARARNGAMYGAQRFERRVRTARGRCSDVVWSLLRDVEAHVGGEHKGDDVTVVAMSVGRMRARRNTDVFPEPSR